MANIETGTTPPASQQRHRQRTSLLLPLRNRNFRLLLAGQVGSLLGDQVYLVALPFFILGHGSTATLGQVLLAFGLARIVLLPVGGVLADRFLSARSWLIVAANFGKMGLLIALTLALPATLPPLMVLAVLLGGLEGISLPPSMSLLPDLVKGDLIGPGNALLNGVVMGTTLFGPALAGLLVTVAGPGPAFAIDAAGIGISALTMYMIATTLGKAPGALDGGTGSAAAAAPDGDGAAERGDGGEDASPQAEPVGEQPAARRRGEFWRLLGSSRMFQFSLLITLIANVTYAGAQQVALPLFSKSVLLTGVRGYGLLLSAFGVGSLAGALLSGRMFGWPGRGKIALGLGVLQGVALTLIPLGHQLWVGMTALAVTGITGGMLDVFYLSMLQQKLPRALLGRSMSALMLTAYGAYPASVAIAAVIVDRYGVTPIFVADGLVVCASFLVGFASREFRNL